QWSNSCPQRQESIMKAPRFKGWFAKLPSLNQPQRRQVLDLILAGMMNKVVADKLGISMRTVEVHRAHIFDKMQVKTAVELAGLLK
ncbi:MAG: DNA-binding response regulator, partial [Oxalobacteraceae bacterium]